ncbi:hypothetical protein NLJ89_g5931 [Agrocybe chaxingu]|uniref:Uncharacterized protein n=1 Tax=Agrocybe chaxingu TaxID=84603 RepID=A0A9W8MWH8_9AGAR|nr:hypothetical protein NLJ89_g5931 [Agrocybe chaxingu]
MAPKPSPELSIEQKLETVQRLFNELDKFEQLLKTDQERELQKVSAAKNREDVGKLQKSYLELIPTYRSQLRRHEKKLRSFLSKIRAPTSGDIRSSAIGIYNDINAYKVSSTERVELEAQIDSDLKDTQKEIKRLSVDYKRTSIERATKRSTDARESDVKSASSDAGSPWNFDGQAPSVRTSQDSQRIIRSGDGTTRTPQSSNCDSIPIGRKILHSGLQGIVEQTSQTASYSVPPVVTSMSSEGLSPRPANIDRGRSFYSGGPNYVHAAPVAPQQTGPLGYPASSPQAPNPGFNSLGYPFGPPLNIGGRPAYAHGGDDNVDRRTADFGGFSSPPLPISHHDHGGSRVRSQSIGSFTGSQASTDTGPSSSGEGYSIARDSYYSVVGGAAQVPAGYYSPQGYPATSSNPLGGGSIYAAGAPPGPSSQHMGWPSSSAAYQSSSGPTYPSQDPRPAGENPWWDGPKDGRYGRK